MSSCSQAGIAFFFGREVIALGPLVAIVRLEPLDDGCGSLETARGSIEPKSLHLLSLRRHARTVGDLRVERRVREGRRASGDQRSKLALRRTPSLPDVSSSPT
jgi:hypothetical protein